MSKKKDKPIIARRRRVPLQGTYIGQRAEREATRAAETQIILQCAQSQSASFARIAQAMERIANSLEPLTVMASVCTCLPKTRKKVKPNV